jgi:hypothetical protein
MTNQQHPITPPPELVEQWMGLSQALAIAAAFQAGADQELEDCVGWLEHHSGVIYPDVLRADRRPRQPSLKVRLSKAIVEGDERQALKLLEELDD